MTKPTDGRSLTIKKTQYDLLMALHTAGATGCTTAELHETTGISLRGVQYSLKRLANRGLVTKFALRHNKNKWYYSEVAADYLTSWPAVPPSAKASSR
jgi:DNA-binding Lrp family transcriptional regulator